MLRLPPFRFLLPKTAREASRMLRDHGPEAMAVAGGTDLLPQMRVGRRTTHRLVDLKAVAELNAIREPGDGAVAIGAAGAAAGSGGTTTVSG